MPRLLSEMVAAVAVAAPEADNRTSALDTQLTQANFDTNMVIILAALLCALICALGLNSMVRCFLRCSHRFGAETAEQAAVRLSATGLKKSALRKLPVAVYYGENGSKGSGTDTGTDLTDTECPICLGEFIDGEKVRVLPKCNHRFHVSCIDTWLRSHSSCPNCRHSVLEAVESSSSKAAERASSTDGGGVPPRGGGVPPRGGGVPPRGGGDGVVQEDQLVVEVSGES